MKKLASAIMIISVLFIAGCTSTLFRNPAWKKFVDNSRIVSVAKRSYQMGHNVEIGTVITWEDLTFCLPAKWKPVCLSGGKLEPGAIGEQMKCSVHGQLADLSTRLRQAR